MASATVQGQLIMLDTVKQDMGRFQQWPEI